MRKYLYICSLIMIAALYLGCSTTNWGVARLPDARTLFITQAKEQSFVAKKDLVVPYQPVGFMEISTKKFQLCGGNTTGMYSSLERAMNYELVEKARDKLGADAVINYSWDVQSSFQNYYACAAQTMSQCPYSAIVLLPSLVPAYVFNINTVLMKGTAVKK